MRHSFTFVHAADLHIDSPLRGLSSYEGAPVERVRGATRRAMENLVELCVDEGAALLLLAGDLFDGDGKDYSTALFFRRQMARLAEAGVQVALVRGNHDAQSKMTRELRRADNVTELPTEAPATHVYDDLAVAVHGQGFARPAVTEDLVRDYPPRVPGALNIGLLHTCLDGREGHAPYAPTSLDELSRKGYDYWALGHVHTREVLSEDPWVLFPGNLQGRHIRETGAKGATVVRVEGGRIVSVEHRSLDVVRWARVEVDAAGAETPEDVVERARDALQRAIEAAEERLLAARIEVTGRTGAHAALVGRREHWDNELRAVAVDLGADAVWVERVKLMTRPAIDVADRLSDDDPVAQLIRGVDALGSDDDTLRDLAAELDALRKKLPAALVDREPTLRLDDHEALRSHLPDVKELLVERLLEAEVSE
ncbi:MAG: DNA repair exonuclease [Myxococcales bacterium]|nr:DNA repair exonuclease [Myxococcales bacterium]